MRFRFIEDRRADYPVTILCDVLGVSPAGYYAWRTRPESRRSAANREIVDNIKQVHRDTRGRYGSPRIHAEMKAQGRGVSRGRIERLMRHHGIRAIMERANPLLASHFRRNFALEFALANARRYRKSTGRLPKGAEYDALYSFLIPAHRIHGALPLTCE